jgi:hypothetical protein
MLSGWTPIPPATGTQFPSIRTSKWPSEPVPHTWGVQRRRDKPDKAETTTPTQ